MDKTLEKKLYEHRDDIDALGEKLDLALELLERIAEGSGDVQAQELDDWKRRCRARAQARRSGRRRRR